MTENITPINPNQAFGVPEEVVTQPVGVEEIIVNNGIEDFLRPSLEEDIQEVIFPAFKQPFKIKAISETQNSAIRKRHTRKTRQNNMQVTETNQDGYTAEMMATCVVYPNLSDTRLQDHYGTQGDEAGTLKAMLRIGEYASLINKISVLNGFDVSTNDVKEEAKND